MNQRIYSAFVACLVLVVASCRPVAEQSADTGREPDATSVSVSPVGAAERDVAVSRNDRQAAVAVAVEEDADLDSVATDDVTKDVGAENADPFGADPFGADPFDAGPFGADPFGADPFDADPFDADPFDADPFDADTADADTADENTADENTADENTADENTADATTADENFGGDQIAGENPADSGADNGSQSAGQEPIVTEKAEGFPPLPPVKGLDLLSKSQQIWIDREKKQVVFDGEVCLTAGRLELLVSHENGKTHEAVIKVKAKASTVHAALLAVGGRQGTPVTYRPEYKPATGGVVEILVRWWDNKGKMHEVPGQQFARNMVTGKALAHDWVFAGSYFWKDEHTGKTVYVADPSGDFICVSNFPTAMLDLPIKSSSENQGLVYEAFTEHIPLKGTKVRLILTPRRDEQGADTPTNE